MKYTDFWDALAALTVMPTPRWRRPNTNGIPGIVSGIDFERMRRSDLMRQLA